MILAVARLRCPFSSKIPLLLACRQPPRQRYSHRMCFSEYQYLARTICFSQMTSYAGNSSSQDRTTNASEPASGLRAVRRAVHASRSRCDRGDGPPPAGSSPIGGGRWLPWVRKDFSCSFLPVPVEGRFSSFTSPAPCGGEDFPPFSFICNRWPPCPAQCDVQRVTSDVRVGVVRLLRAVHLWVALHPLRFTAVFVTVTTGRAWGCRKSIATVAVRPLRSRGRTA